MVKVPASGLLNLEGGVSVSGRIAAGGLPAVITLAPRGHFEATHNTLTDDDGWFTIPGVLPGPYRLRARPDRGNGTRNIPQVDIEVGTEPLDLGDLRGEADDVEIDSRVELPPGLIDRVRAEAAKHSARRVESIWPGELVHPLGNYGARVTFRPEPAPDDPTTATQRTLLVRIPGEAFRNYYPQSGALGYGFHFDDGRFEKVSTFDHPLRVFPLRSITLHLPLEKGVDYDDALALLHAIEDGAFRTPKSESKRTGPNTWTGTFSGFTTCPPEALPQIFSVRKEADGTLQIRTRDRPFGGRSYIFKKTPDGTFEITGGGSWVS